jgi:hypothetical protein
MPLTPIEMLMTWLRERAGLKNNIDYCYVRRPGGRVVFFVPQTELSKVSEAAKHFFGEVDYEAGRVMVIAYDLPLEASVPVIVPAAPPLRRRG